MPMSGELANLERSGIARAVILGVVWLVVAGCRGAAETQAPAPAPVRTVRAAPATLVDRVRLAGRLVPRPDRDATLAPLVAGRLSSVEVRQGQTVRKGEVLARIDPASLDSAVGAAEAAERRADAERAFRGKAAERSKLLHDKGVASLEEAEADEAAAVAAESAHAEAAAALEEARRRRSWSELRAPFDGVVVRVLRGAGEQADGTPATAVLEIASPEPLEVAAGATAETLARLSTGIEAVILAPGSDAVAFRARVIRSARAIDPATGIGEVRLQPLGTPRSSLVLGAAVEVLAEVSRKRAAVTVPAAAVCRSAGEASEVVVVEGGRARPRAVTTGLADGEQIEILTGLTAGEEVVIDDPLALADGAPVAVKP